MDEGETENREPSSVGEADDFGVSVPVVPSFSGSESADDQDDGGARSAVTAERPARPPAGGGAASSIRLAPLVAPTRRLAYSHPSVRGEGARHRDPRPPEVGACRRLLVNRLGLAAAWASRISRCRRPTVFRPRLPLRGK